MNAARGLKGARMTHRSMGPVLVVLALVALAFLPSRVAAQSHCTGCTITGTAGNDTLNGGRAADVICGLAGDDTIYGFSSGDGLCGDEGSDDLYGGLGPDTLHGHGGNDYLFG